MAITDSQIMKMAEGIFPQFHTRKQIKTNGKRTANEAKRIGNKRIRMVKNKIQMSESPEDRV
jgi:hypothetical protein